ncbi:MAG: CehA/McbA family metallohydrolase [Planctomycetota bacterium]
MKTRASVLPILLAGSALGLGWWLPTQEQEPGTLVLEHPVHLGNDKTPEWPEAAATPDAAKSYRFAFEVTEVGAERAIEITKRHVDGDWTLSLNDFPFARLPRGADRTTHILPLPENILVVGTNHLEVAIEKVGDDITLGPVRLLDRPYRAIFEVAPVMIQVTDEQGVPLPARLTVVRADDSFAPLHYADRTAVPVRDGVAYTDAEGKARLEIGADAVRIFATHGPEWSVAEMELREDGKRRKEVALQLRREVDTTGWLSADTHIHTLTFSGHGDASLEERVLSLAGDDVEVAIATDHNHHTDYAPSQKAAGLEEHYLAVVGNEVSTDLGHFNAFPLDPAGPIPNHKLQEWQPLVDDMRKQGAKVVILNHPRWPDREEGPFGVSDLDPRTGYFADGLQLPVDALEVFNSTTPITPWPEVMRDWFSLLNAGSRVRGVGSSDSHAVLDPVGQGRTWLQSSTDNPSEASIDALCEAFTDGNSSMGIGLFGHASVHGKGSGEFAQPVEGEVEVQFHVASASWVAAEKAVVYQNGVSVAEMLLTHDAPDAPHRNDLVLRYPAPAHDAWIVCVATGPRPSGPWWYSLFDDVALVTNPIWLDVDGDGHFSSPAETAESALEDLPTDVLGKPQFGFLASTLGHCDQAVAVQVMVLAQRRWGAEHPEAVAQLPKLFPAHRDHLQSLLSPR